MSLSFYSGLDRAYLPQHWAENSLEHAAICLKGTPAAGTHLILNLTLLPADKAKTPPSKDCAMILGEADRKRPGGRGTNGFPGLGEKTIKGYGPPTAVWGWACMRGGCTQGPGLLKAGHRRADAIQEGRGRSAEGHSERVASAGREACGKTLPHSACSPGVDRALGSKEHRSHNAVVSRRSLQRV